MPQALVIGSTSAPEFGNVLAELRLRMGKDRLVTHESLGRCLAQPAGESPRAELILILQAWPDEHAPRQVLDLLDRFPLARLMVCCGPWCDSDGRTRHVWPLGTRIPAALAVERLRRELAVLSATDDPLPLTANRDDTYRFDHPVASPTFGERNVAVAIRTADAEVGRWLEDVLKAAGHTIVDGGHGDAELVIWDVDPFTPGVVSQMTSTMQQLPGLPIIALGNFLRQHEWDDLKDCGVASVVSKLAASTELLRTIESAMKGHSTSPDASNQSQHRLRIAQ